MSDDKFNNKYRISSARAMWHHYGGGSYFITVCTKNHIHYFGEIVTTDAPSDESMKPHNNVIMKFTPVGQFLNDQILNVKSHYSYATIPLFVVMPNHFHLIIIIDKNTPYQRRSVSQSGAPVGIATQQAINLCNVNDESKNKVMATTSDLQGWLSVVIGGIKSAVTKYANENGIEFAWLRLFNDHIIRDQDQWNKIAEYIINNPLRWHEDRFNKK
jgi:REP element-mobilizing transposase RayT